jgi:hypothetical protein
MLFTCWTLETLETPETLETLEALKTQSEHLTLEHFDTRCCSLVGHWAQLTLGSGTLEHIGHSTVTVDTEHLTLEAHWTLDTGDTWTLRHS